MSRNARASIAKLYRFLTANWFGCILNRTLLNLSLTGMGYFVPIDSEKNGEFKFLLSLPNDDNNLFIDIGANVGSYSHFILKHKKGTVLAFEPLPDNFKVLARLKGEFGDRIILFNNAVGNQSSTVTIYSDNPTSELATLSNEVLENAYGVEKFLTEYHVSMVSLDSELSKLDLENKILQLVKIDVEGFELEVLQGMTETLKKLKPKYIQLEFNWFHLYRGHTIFCFKKCCQITRPLDYFRAGNSY